MNCNLFHYGYTIPGKNRVHIKRHLLLGLHTIKRVWDQHPTISGAYCKAQQNLMLRVSLDLVIPPNQTPMKV